MSVVQKIIIGFFVFVTIYSTFEVYEKLSSPSASEPVWHISIRLFVVFVLAQTYTLFIVYRQRKKRIALEEELKKIRKELNQYRGR